MRRQHVKIVSHQFEACALQQIAHLVTRNVLFVQRLRANTQRQPSEVLQSSSARLQDGSGLPRRVQHQQVRHIVGKLKRLNRLCQRLRWHRQVADARQSRLIVQQAGGRLEPAFTWVVQHPQCQFTRLRRNSRDDH